MKRFVYVFMILGWVVGCQPANQEDQGGLDTDSLSVDSAMTITFPEKAKNMTIYEVNIRQHTQEGTINAFVKDIPRIKDLGTEILWIMPIHPIGEVGRKGTLGSYYSVKDYRAVNHEFGTMEDFKQLVNAAHEQGLYVIIDWVPNHTSRDHAWTKEHPEYYVKDEEGNITWESDWSDTALLNHENEELRRKMLEEMKFWVEEADIDGFRVDHAAEEIPMILWEEIIPALNDIKDMFWLAEWNDPKLHGPFHASYNWELFHKTNEVGKGSAKSDILVEYTLEDIQKFGVEPFRLNMITNHDENSWNGTVYERYGEGHKTYAVFMYTVGGIPMVYSGQEVGLDHRLEFFEKDNIDWSDPKGLTSFYSQLIDLRKENEALWSGIYGGTTHFRDDNNEDVVAYTRVKNGNEVTVVLNFSGEKEEVNIIGLGGQEMKEYFSGETITTSSDLTLEPYQYLVLIK